MQVKKQTTWRRLSALLLLLGVRFGWACRGSWLERYML